MERHAGHTHSQVTGEMLTKPKAHHKYPASSIPVRMGKRNVTTNNGA